jgi:hypothetical protein
MTADEPLEEVAKLSERLDLVELCLRHGYAAAQSRSVSPMSQLAVP